MKPFKIRLSQIFLGLSPLLMCAPLEIHAQGDGRPLASGIGMTLTISASILLQAADSTNQTGNTTRSTVTKVKVTTASILHDAGAPAGSKLLWQPGGVEVDIVDKNDTKLSSISLSITPASPGVWSGTSDLDSGSQSYSGIFPIGVIYNDGNGTSLNVQGLATEKSALSKADSHGIHKPSDSVSMSLSGSATGANAGGVATATIKASGKGAL